ncbi:MAG: amidohydrolase family protein [Acidobacteria bacterium]|nr:amidohydrolase family protein [Acidobacteriota bacterium]MBV9187429.1 amidohydrolase family protein [Acidobacteriota bacterium]
MRKTLATLLFLLIAAPLIAAPADDIAAARAVFEANINAIRQRNRDAYLSYYLHSPSLVRGGPDGFDTGFESFAKGAGAQWPDLIEANDIHLTPLQPGIVYGTYRYRVRYGSDEHSGISERLFVSTPDGWKIAVTGAIDSPAGTPAPPRALTGATLIDGRGGAPIANTNVILRDGKIDCAGTAAQCPVPEGVDVTDVRGLWIMPGLIDAHVHFSQTGWADGRPDSLDMRATHPYDQTEAALKADPERYGRSYVCSGVTAVYDVGGYAWTLRLHDRFEPNTLAPHVDAAGPLLSTLDHWLNLPAERQFIVLNDASARDGVRYLASQGAHAVKVWYIVRPPDLTVEASAAAVAAAGDEARKHNIPLIVHATGLAEAKAALRAGATLLVHSVSDKPVDQEFLDLAKRNGTILIPTLIVSRGYVRMFRSAVEHTPVAIDDPNGCVDKSTLARIAETTSAPTTLTAEQLARRDQRTSQGEEIAAQNLKALVAAGIPIATGTDAGNPLTLHGPAIYAEMESMQKAGMTPMQVLVSSTAVAARAMRRETEFGTVEKGKDADLVIVSADPSADVANIRKIRYVVRGGVMRTIDDLHALAQK